MGVLINMPFGGRRDGNLLRKLGPKELPAWAREIGADSWAQVLLKFIVAHPAVTCAIPATSKVAHLQENMGAMRGAQPASEVLIEGVLASPDGPVETAETTLDYLAPDSERTGGLWFSRDPSGLELQLHAKGYAAP